MVVFEIVINTLKIEREETKDLMCLGSFKIELP